MVSMYAKKKNLVLSVSVVIGIIFIGIFFLSSSQSTKARFNKMLLPSPVNYKADELPQLEDYYKWNWHIKTFAYRSLNTLQDEYIVEYPRYNNENGIITETKNIMIYNQSFKDNPFNEIDELSFDAIEKVIKSEGQNTSFGYSIAKSYNTNLLSIIMMILCLFVLLFMYFSTIISKDSKK